MSSMQFFLLSQHSRLSFVLSLRCSLHSFKGFQQFDVFIFTPVSRRRPITNVQDITATPRASTASVASEVTLREGFSI